MLQGVSDHLYTLYFGVHRKAAMLSCDVCGVVPSDMLFVPKKNFKRSPTDTMDQILIRYTMHERHRQVIFHRLLEEKDKLLRDPHLSRKWKERKRLLPDAPPPPKISKKKIRNAQKALKRMISGFPHQEENIISPQPSPSPQMESFPLLFSSHGELVEEGLPPPRVMPSAVMESREESNQALALTPISAPAEEGRNSVSPPPGYAVIASQSATMADDRQDVSSSVCMLREKAQSTSFTAMDNNPMIDPLPQKAKMGGEPPLSLLASVDRKDEPNKEREEVLESGGKEKVISKLAAFGFPNIRTEGVGPSAAASFGSPYYTSPRGADDFSHVLFSSPLRVALGSNALSPAEVGGSATPTTHADELALGVGGGEATERVGIAGSPSLMHKPVEEGSATVKRSAEVKMNLFHPTSFLHFGVLRDTTPGHFQKGFPVKPPLPPPGRSPRTFQSLKKEVQDLEETKQRMMQYALPLARQKAQEEDYRSSDTNEIPADTDSKMKATPSILGRPHPFLPTPSTYVTKDERWAPCLGSSAEPLVESPAKDNPAVPVPADMSSEVTSYPICNEKKKLEEAKKNVSIFRQSTIPGGTEGSSMAYPSSSSVNVSKEELPISISQSKGGEQYSFNSKSETCFSSFAGSPNKNKGVAWQKLTDDGFSPAAERTKKEMEKRLKNKHQTFLEHVDSHIRQVDAIKRVAVIEAKQAENSFRKGLQNMEEEVPPQGTISHYLYRTRLTVKPPSFNKRLQGMRKHQQQQLSSIQQKQNLLDSQLVEKLNHGASFAERQRDEYRIQRKEVNENRILIFKDQVKILARRKDAERRQRLAQVEKRHQKADAFNEEKFKGTAARRRVEHDREGMLRRMLRRELQVMNQSKRWEVQKIKQLEA